MTDFKDEFQNQLRSLDEAITAAVTSNNERNNTFSNTVIENLTQINTRIATLANGIRQLKDQLNTLQTQIQQNDGQIQNNTGQMTNLQNENAQLRQQLDAIQNDSEQMRQEIQSRQNTIDNYENQLRVLTDERDALRNNLNATGDVGAQHATEIQNLTQGFESQIEEKNTQIQTLQNEITGKDTEIERLTRELESKNNQLEQLNLQTNQNDERLNELQSRNEELVIENTDLTHIITEATTAIRIAIERMREFNNPNAFNETGKDDILRTINESIENINNIISGAPNQGSPPPMQAPPMLAAPRQNMTQKSSKTYTWPPLEPINVSGQLYTNTNELMTQLEKKAKQQPFDNNTRNPSKYALALQEIKAAIESGTDIPNNIGQILTRNVSINNNKITGGKTKKRRKYKKQRGGFTYKHNAKRKTFSTTLNIAKGNSKKTSKRFKK